MKLLLIFLSLTIHCQLSEASPVDALTEFHKPKNPQLEEPLEPVSDSAKVVSNSTKVVSDTKPLVLHHLPEEVPFVVGHHPVPYQSLRVTTDLDNYWFSLNFQLVPHEFEKVGILKDFVSGLSFLDPRMELGFLTKLGEKKAWFYGGILTGLKKDDHGMKFKAQVYSETYKDVFNSSRGRVAVYYYYDKIAYFSHKDFITFYTGYYSPFLKVDLSDFEEFKGSFKDLKEHKDNFIIGIFYSPSIIYNYSVNLEASLNQYSVSFNYLL